MRENRLKNTRPKFVIAPAGQTDDSSFDGYLPAVHTRDLRAVIADRRIRQLSRSDIVWAQFKRGRIGGMANGQTANRRPLPSG